MELNEKQTATKVHYHSQFSNFLLCCEVCAVFVWTPLVFFIGFSGKKTNDSFHRPL